MTRYGWIIAPALFLAACGDTRENAQIERLESGVLFRNDGPELSTVDPHQADGSWTEPIMGDLWTGLMKTGPSGDPVAGLAERWTVSEDGLLWTFYLREAVWSDGRPMTAEDVVFSLRRAVDPATAAAYVDVYGPVVNAEAILLGEAEPETLGVSAPDSMTVEIRLVHPMPFLPDLLADSRAAIVPQHAIDAFGDDWTDPENIVVSGPYTLVERAIDRQTVLRRNPLYFGDADTCFDEVFNFPIDVPETATRLARAGDLDIAARVPAAMQDRVREELPGYLQFVSPPAAFFLMPNTNMAPFDDRRVREALGISIDRRFAFEEVIPSGLSVTNSLVPEGLSAPFESARVAWSETPLEERREQALAMLAEAGFGPGAPLEFELAYPSGGVMDRIAPALQSDWNSLADWVEVEIFGIETAVHYQNLGAGEFDVAVSGWTASIRDVSYMLDVIRPDSAGNFGDWTNLEVEALLEAALREQDPAARADLLRQAEQIALDDAAITPFYNLNRGWIIHPRLEGWIGGAFEYTPSHLICLTDPQ